MVVAYEAVTSGWRVLWLVAAVATPSDVEYGADRARQRDRLLDVVPLRDERRAEPDGLGRGDLGSQFRGGQRGACQGVEAELVELGHAHLLAPTGVQVPAGCRSPGGYQVSSFTSVPFS